MRRRTVHADPSGVSRPPWRVLVVDDYEPWRRAVRSALATLTHWQIVGEASDGLEAVHQAQALQPDLVLLDVGLPRRNGIAAAQEIIGVAPTSSILFITEQRSWAIAQAALATGAPATSSSPMPDASSSPRWRRLSKAVGSSARASAVAGPSRQ